MYALTQKVTLTKLAFQQQKQLELTPEQVRLLAQVQPVATDEERRTFLATREQAPADLDLNPEAVAHFRERLGV